LFIICEFSGDGDIEFEAASNTIGEKSGAKEIETVVLK